jgi:hypothetical protein
MRRDPRMERGPGSRERVLPILFCYRCLGSAICSYTCILKPFTVLALKSVYYLDGEKATFDTHVDGY